MKTLDQRKKELLAKCKYYHGEEECPEGKPWKTFERFWAAEMFYVSYKFEGPAYHRGKSYETEVDYWETDGIVYCLALFPVLTDFLSKFDKDVQGMLACIIVDVVDHSDIDGPDFILNYGNK